MKEYQQPFPAEALRDFFMSSNLEEIKESIHEMQIDETPPSSDQPGWSEIEFAFNRLFIGPQSVLAPLYASIYLDPEPYVMGQTTLVVRKIYESIGLSFPLRGQYPDDHISLEIDACLILHRLLEENPHEDLIEVYDYFLNKHMSQWVPELGNKIRNAPAIPELMKKIENMLSNWMEEERNWLNKLVIH